MKRIISKKGMVGVLTASAIAATMAGSYAIWDTLESTGTATLTLEKPVVAETALDANFAIDGTRKLGETGTYKNTVTFTVADAKDLTKLQASFVPIIKDASSQDCTSQFTIKISEGSTELTSNTDTSVDASNTYTIEVTPTEAAASLAGTALTVEVKGTLSEESTS